MRLSDALRQYDLYERVSFLMQDCDKPWQALLRAWEFKRNHSLNQMGLCSFSRQAIFVSKHVSSIHERGEFLDTLAHEVAHLVERMLYGVSSKHGAHWQAIAVFLGARPEPAGDSIGQREAYKRAQKLVGVCELCGYRFFRARALPRKSNQTHGKGCGGTIRKVYR